MRKQECLYQVEWKKAKEKRRKGKLTSVIDFAELCEELREDLGEFWEEVKTELNTIREEMEVMWIAFDRGMKKTREEVRGIFQNSLAKITGMFTSLVEEVKSQEKKNRDQLESHLNLGEEDEAMEEVAELGGDLINLMDQNLYIVFLINCI